MEDKFDSGWKMDAALAKLRREQLEKVSKMLATGRYGDLKKYAAEQERRAEIRRNRTPAETERFIQETLTRLRREQGVPRPARKPSVPA